jgi:hypothetical protein
MCTLLTLAMTLKRHSRRGDAASASTQPHEKHGCNACAWAKVTSQSNFNLVKKRQHYVRIL